MLIDALIQLVKQCLALLFSKFKLAVNVKKSDTKKVHEVSYYYHLAHRIEYFIFVTYT